MKITKGKTVILHGFTGNAASMEHFVAAFAEPDVVAVDMPGFGLNHRPYSLNWRSYAEATLQSIDDVVGSHEPFHLVGHSHGAMVAFCLAAWFPGRVVSLSLVCPVAEKNRTVKALFAITNRFVKLLGEEKLVDTVARPTIVDIASVLLKDKSWNEDTLTRIKQLRRQESVHYSTAMLRLTSLIDEFKTTCDDLRVHAPVVIIAADNDRMVSQADITWYVQHSEQSHVRRAPGGHLLPLAFPEHCARLIKTDGLLTHHVSNQLARR